MTNALLINKNSFIKAAQTFKYSSSPRNLQGYYRLDLRNTSLVPNGGSHRPIANPNCYPVFLRSTFQSRRTIMAPAMDKNASVREVTMRENRHSSVERITDTLETPSLDDRSYRVIKLPNQLEVLLVHDPETDKASAAMDVNVGNFSDDADMPGVCILLSCLRA